MPGIGSPATHPPGESEQQHGGFHTWNQRLLPNLGQAETTYSYDPFALDVASVTDPNGNSTTFGYDSAGNVTSLSRSISNGATQVTTYGHGDVACPGDVTSMVDPNGQTCKQTYDAAGDLTAIADPLGEVPSYGYDQLGRHTFATSARGNATGADPAAYTSGAAGRLVGSLVTRLAGARRAVADVAVGREVAAVVVACRPLRDAVRLAVSLSVSRAPPRGRTRRLGRGRALQAWPGSGSRATSRL